MVSLIKNSFGAVGPLIFSVTFFKVQLSLSTWFLVFLLKERIIGIKLASKR
ncbi:hypothetical protein STRDD12_01334 [Streptococcus sp. DD12]|nr:hypothetical protein STRDD12_01334 [Streptococcus sp. DD12]